MDFSLSLHPSDKKKDLERRTLQILGGYVQDYATHEDRTKYRRQLSALEGRLKKNGVRQPDLDAAVRRCLRKVNLAKEL